MKYESGRESYMSTMMARWYHKTAFDFLHKERWSYDWWRNRYSQRPGELL